MCIVKCFCSVFCIRLPPDSEVRGLMASSWHRHHDYQAPQQRCEGTNDQPGRPFLNKSSQKPHQPHQQAEGAERSEKSTENRQCEPFQNATYETVQCIKNDLTYHFVQRRQQSSQNTDEHSLSQATSTSRVRLTAFKSYSGKAMLLAAP